MLHAQDQFGELLEKLYLAQEMKVSLDKEKSQGVERMKINCASRHFEAIAVDYDVVSTAMTSRTVDR